MMKTKPNIYGYTLVEILVVIAIIAVLAAVIVPVTIHCKAKAQQTTCTSNLKQIGTAVIMYSQDNDRYLPPYANAIPDPSGEIHSLAIPDPEQLHSALSRYAKNAKAWFCPSDPVAGKEVVKWAVYHRYSSYYFNFRWPPAQLRDDGFHFPHGKVLPPSKMPIVKDANWSVNRPDSTMPGCQHYDGYNTWYLDGHSKWQLMRGLEDQDN